MIIVRLMGGLGNQLQQYALYRKLETLGKDVFLDTFWFEKDIQTSVLAPRTLELDLFENINYRAATKEQIEAIIGSNKLVSKVWRNIQKRLLGKDKHIYESVMYEPSLFEMDDIYIEGYWAAEKYYADILNELKKEITFDICKAQNVEAIQKAADDIRSSEKSCSVHIRRGDYLDPANMELFGNIATEEYYEKAFEMIRTEFPGTRFFIFSDDPEYVLQKYGDQKDVQLIDINHGLDSRYDIYLMSLCDMHICANSTFSFWGVRLSEGHRPMEHMSSGADQTESSIQKNRTPIINIRPTIQKNTQVYDAELMHDLWKGWTFIDPLGQLK